ncbi:MAG: hypothetical protein Q9217_002926 [Psora testacea]
MSGPQPATGWDPASFPPTPTAGNPLDDIDGTKTEASPSQSAANPSFPDGTQQPLPTTSKSFHPSPSHQTAQPMDPRTPRSQDTIFLRALHIEATLGADAWNRPNKRQPIILSLSLTLDTTSTGTSDDISYTFSYGQVCADVTKNLDRHGFLSLDHLTSDLASLASNWPGESLKIVAQAPKALLRVEGGLGLELVLRRPRPLRGEEQKNISQSNQLTWHVASREWTMTALKPACIIGVNPHERLEKQIVCIDLRVWGHKDAEAYSAQIKEGPQMWRRMVTRTCEVVEPSSFKTLEALAALLAEMLLQEFPCPRIGVRIEKPSALASVEGAGVEIVRDRRG